MHTIMVMSGGFVLLLLCLLGARLLGASTGTAMLAFLPLWLLATLVNMYIGVTQAGYSVAAELPILLVLFGVPAAVALFIRWRFGAG
jgi:hypothetical protein